MTGTTHTSSQIRQAEFDTDRFSIGIDNRCYITMPYLKQDFVGPLKKRRRIINGFEGPMVHIIYEGTVYWTINDDSGHPHQIEVPNSLNVPKGRAWLISPHH